MTVLIENFLVINLSDLYVSNLFSFKKTALFQWHRVKRTRTIYSAIQSINSF